MLIIQKNDKFTLAPCRGLSLEKTEALEITISSCLHALSAIPGPTCARNTAWSWVGSRVWTPPSRTSSGRTRSPVWTGATPTSWTLSTRTPARSPTWAWASSRAAATSTSIPTGESSWPAVTGPSWECWLRWELPDRTFQSFLEPHNPWKGGCCLETSVREFRGFKAVKFSVGCFGKLN